MNCKLPAAGMSGELVSLDENGRAHLLLNLLNRAVPTDVDADALSLPA
jgi:hypothetical protein